MANKTTTNEALTMALEFLANNGDKEAKEQLAAEKKHLPKVQQLTQEHLEKLRELKGQPKEEK
jgi:hypothetical protein